MGERLAGKVGLVTGGASGIGRAVVQGYVQEGCRVVALDTSQAGLTSLETELPEYVRTVQGDVRDPTAHERAINICMEGFGKLDVLVPNAGVLDGFLRLEDLPVRTLALGFRDIFDVNVKGYLLAIRAAVGALRESRGCVVCTTSTAGLHAGGGGVIYTASKHAVVGLVRELAYELAPDIRVNAVAPGGTMTSLGTPASLRFVGSGQPESEERKTRIERRNPLHLAQQPSDHVGAYLLLASDESRAMTGTVLESDGGIGVRG